MTGQNDAPDKGLAALSILVTPNDVNHLGTLFGGRLVALMDQAAFIAGARRAGQSVVTASIEKIDFAVPVYLGELLTVEARVVDVGRTSLQVAVTAYAEDLRTGDRRQATTGRLVMVAVDKAGRPTPVRPADARA
jgi:acyl-CoA thioesterase YciA